MTYALVAVSTTLVLFVYFTNCAARGVQRGLREARQAFDAERQAWTQERRELLNRIQRPEVVQHAPVAESFPVPEPEPDDIGLVGSIRHDPDYEFDSSLADALTGAAFPEA